MDRQAVLMLLLGRGWQVDRMKGDGSEQFSVVLRLV